MCTPGYSPIKFGLDLGDRGDVGLTIPQVKTLRGVRARVSGIVSLSKFGWS